MTNSVALVLAMAAGVYGLRIGGLLLATVVVPATWERALAFVPIATLTALVVSSLAGRADESGIRLLAALAAGLAARCLGKAWVCILCGMGVYWLLRLL